MEFLVNTKKISQVADEIEKCTGTIQTTWSTVVNVRNHCAISGSSRAAVLHSLRKIQEELEEQEGNLERMSNVLREISYAYNGSEEKIVNALSKEANSLTGTNPPAETGGGITEKEKWYDGLDEVWDEVGMFGPLINFVIPGRDVVGRLKSLSSLIGKGAEVVGAGCKTAKEWGKKIAGFGEGISGIDTSSPWGAFKSSLKSQFTDELGFGVDDIGKTSTKVKVAAKWAGHILTVAENGFDNYKEWEEGGISVGRAVSETVIESAVDIGVGVLATAGVTTVATTAAIALGIGTPAIAIGVGAAMVTWAANGVCKWVTDAVTGEAKDLGEVVADGICDVGEGAVSVVQDIGTGIGKAVNKFANEISAKWTEPIFSAV